MGGQRGVFFYEDRESPVCAQLGLLTDVYG